MPTVTIYEIRSGRISRVVTAPESMIQYQAQAGESYVAGSANTLTQYVNTAKRRVENRPTINGAVSKNPFVADGVDTSCISGLPKPCIVLFEGEQYLTEDGVFEFTTDVPGIFQVIVQAWPYLDKTFTIEAVEA